MESMISKEILAHFVNYDTDVAGTVTLVRAHLLFEAVKFKCLLVLFLK